jgi:glyoxylase-like metal-dependent hydrolase (beta-lactamase superfamily II)
MYCKYSILIIALMGSMQSFSQKTIDNLVEKSSGKAKTTYTANKIGVTLVRDSIFMLKGRGGNIGVSVGEDGVFIIDSQFPDASADILNRIKSLSKKPVKILINTHHHGDHVGGNTNLTAGGALLFSHEKARARMLAPYVEAGRENYQNKIDSILKLRAPKISTKEDRKAATKDAEKIAGTVEDNMDTPDGLFPVVSFSNDLKFNFNGDKIIAVHVPKAHTDGDLIIYFSKSNVIHTGDAFVSNTYPFIDANNSGSLDGYLKGLKKITNLMNDETKVIPGHGDIATKEDVLYTYRMLMFLNDRIAFHILQNKTEDQVAAMVKLTKEFDDKGFGEGFITTERLVRTLYKEIDKTYKKEN